MRAQRPCRICADEKARAWINVVTEQEGLSPRQIARGKQAGYGFTRQQIARHLASCKVDMPEDAARVPDASVSYLGNSADSKEAEIYKCVPSPGSAELAEGEGQDFGPEAA